MSIEVEELVGGSRLSHLFSHKHKIVLANLLEFVRADKIHVRAKLIIISLRIPG